MLAYIAGVWYFASQIGIWFLVMMAGFGAFGYLRGRSAARQSELLWTSLTGTDPAGERQRGHVSPAVQSYLKDRADVVGALIARAASEIYLKQNEVPEGAEVVARQNLNAELRHKGLWDKLERAEADLMSAPDGGWGMESLNETQTWCEQLRLLRWTLRIDKELTPLAHFPRLDFSLARELNRATGEPLASWNLRAERDISLTYLARIVAELRSRGILGPGDDVDAWDGQLRGECLGESKDLLVDSKTISDLDESVLRKLGAISSARERYAAYLVEQLSLEVPISFATWWRTVSAPQRSSESGSS